MLRPIKDVIVVRLKHRHLYSVWTFFGRAWRVLHILVHSDCEELLAVPQKSSKSQASGEEDTKEEEHLNIFVAS